MERDRVMVMFVVAPFCVGNVLYNVFGNDPAASLKSQLCNGLALNTNLPAGTLLAESTIVAF
jgi:hypothetical protein